MLINELAKLSGVSTRTLRYYDEIGLLSPSTKNESGYRQYSQREIDLLQQILFYKELGMPLSQIQEIIHSSNYNLLDSLYAHREKLIIKDLYVKEMIETVNKTIASIEEEQCMSNDEKFDVFKRKLVEDNEMKYGKEIRSLYGDETVNTSNEKLRSMTESQYDAVTQLEASLFERLREAMKTGDATSQIAHEVAELHKRWLSFYWTKYSKEAHVGLVTMYLADSRFISYYDDGVEQGATQFLHDCVISYTSN
ncbi:MerR family transcriptional regulator [Lysinibacillus sp. 54212]|uniref:MerR family transcriptional regulator n=1 Tax=Lysinibacillus sp. 54212 TaxID=3119829 RepID=UPI002FC7D53C